MTTIPFGRLQMHPGHLIRHVCWWFSRSNRNTFKIFYWLVTWELSPIWNRKSYLEERTLSPISNFAFLFFRRSLLQSLNKSQILEYHLVLNKRSDSLCIPSCDKMSQRVIVHVSIVFHVDRKFNSFWFHCTFSKCSTGLTQGRVKLTSLSSPKSWYHSSKFHYFLIPSFLGALFCSHGWKWCTTLPGKRRLHSICIHCVQTNKWRN